MNTKTTFIIVKLFAVIIGSLTLILFHPSIAAEEIKVPVGQQSTQNMDVERPKSGMSKAQVEQDFGKPQQTTDPVGEPPISSWEYAGYIVYFEYDRVIHSVLK